MWFHRSLLVSENVSLHRFPAWLCKILKKLVISWNIRIVANTAQGKEISQPIRFRKGLPQEDMLWPTLFTLCINPISCKLWATEVYRLTKPIATKNYTPLIYWRPGVIRCNWKQAEKSDDVGKGGNGKYSIGLKWNVKKCAVSHWKRGQIEQNKEDIKIADRSQTHKKYKQWQHLQIPWSPWER